MSNESRAMAAFEETKARYNEVFRRLADPQEPIDPIFSKDGEPTTSLSAFNDVEVPPGTPLPLASITQITPEYVLEELYVGILYRVQEGIITRNSRVNGTLISIKKDNEE